MKRKRSTRPHEKTCGAKTRAGTPCKKPPMQGQKRCRNHGGASPQAKKKGAERVALAKIGELVEQLRPDSRVDPLDELLGVIGLDARMVALLETEVHEFTVHPEVSALGPPGALGIRPAFYGPNHLGDGAPHILAAELKRWSDQLARHCKLALDAGVAERQVRLAEEQGRLIVRVIESMLDDPALGLTKKQRSAGRKVAARHLRAVGEPA